MNYRKLAIVFSVLLLLIALPVGLVVYRSTADGEKVDATAVEAKQHVIYSVKNEEGQADYVAMLNREFFDKVPIEKNFLVAVMETNSVNRFFGTERYIIDDYKKRFEFRQPPPIPLETWEFENVVAERFPKLQFTKHDILFLIQRGALFQQWREEGKAEILDAVLQIQSPALNEILAQLDRRPLFAVPLVDNRELLDNTINNVEGQMLNIGRWLNMRAGAHLLRGELEAAWLDSRALLQLADRAAQGTTTEHAELSLMIWRFAYRNLRILLTRQDLERELLKKIHSELESLMPQCDFVKQVDIGKRACCHELMNVAMIKNKFTDDTEQYIGQAEDIEPLMPAWVHTNSAIDQFNRYVDEVVELLRDPPEDVLRAAEVLRQKRMADLAKSDSAIPSVSADEHRKAVRGLLGVSEEYSRGWLDYVVSLYVESTALQRGLRLAVEIRMQQMESGTYPIQLAELSDTIDPRSFMDPYTGKQWTYDVAENRVVLHGPGGDGKDSRGEFPEYVHLDDIYYEFSIEPAVAK